MRKLRKRYEKCIDCLHLSYGESCRTIIEEISRGVELRRDPITKYIVGYTIDNFSKRIKDKTSPFFGLSIKNLNGIEKILWHLS